MKKTIISLLLSLVCLLCSCSEKEQPACSGHKDADNNGKCDLCTTSLLVNFDLYAINDLHGKFDDTSSQIGVDELTTFLKRSKATDKNAFFLSSGDMWQGSSESNLTKGKIVTEWMNDLDFVSMTLGNHEYDWGEEYIEQNEALAEFPFLAINVYERETNKRVNYADASVMVECDGLQIGIIGAIGDCYSSISGEHTEDVYFKTGSELSKLVREESTKLRGMGADFIVYSLHDGFGSSKKESTGISDNQLSAYYDVELSNGFVDLVFEGHTHQKYVLTDKYGVYHLQKILQKISARAVEKVYDMPHTEGQTRDYDGSPLAILAHCVKQ
jgi:2',3'-cyclic-nucleotide 2'-phosphodiesterase (5'-nucleotidase family)